MTFISPIYFKQFFIRRMSLCNLVASGYLTLKLNISSNPEKTTNISNGRPNDT